MRHLVRRRLRARLHAGGATAGPADRGAAVSGVMLVIALAALVLLLTLVVPVMHSTANSDQADDAADAAALAAAQRIRELALDRVTGLAVGESVASALPPSAGVSQAATYASRNGADLVGSAYDLDAARGRVELEVLLRDAGEAGAPGRTHRYAAAEVGVALGRCSLESRAEIIGYEDPPEPEPEPEPTPTPTGTPTQSPTPTPTSTPSPTPIPIWGETYRFVCVPGLGSDASFTGPWELRRSDALARGRSFLDNELEPRLVP